MSGRIGRLRQVLQICNDLVNNIPSSDDNPVQKAVKLASIAEVVLTHVEGEESAIESFVARRGLNKRTSQQFVDLFFTTPLKDIFELRRVQVAEECQVVEATDEKVGTFYFVEYGKMFKRYDPDFYFKGNVDFEAVLGRLWSHFDDRINVRISRTGSQANLEYTSFPLSKDAVYGSAAKLIDQFVKKHRLMQVDDVARTYLFVGPPGLGKSTQVQHIAQSIGTRILRLSAQSLPEFQAGEMGFLLGALQPDVLVVDDVDKGGVRGGSRYSNSEDQSATLLSIMEWIKEDHPQVAFFMTANEISELPEPMVRPGRVDDIVWFDKPNKRDRRAILKGYIEALVPEDKQPTAKGLELMVTKTESLGAAWLKEVALQCRYEDQKGVLKAITAMKRMSEPKRTRVLRPRRRKRTPQQLEKAAQRAAKRAGLKVVADETKEVADGG